MGDRHQGGDYDLAARHLCQLADIRYTKSNICEQSCGQWYELATGRGHDHPSRRAREERQPEFVLDSLDGAGQCGLRDTELGGRGGEGAITSDGDERAQMPRAQVEAEITGSCRA